MISETLMGSDLEGTDFSLFFFLISYPNTRRAQATSPFWQRDTTVTMGCFVGHILQPGGLRFGHTWLTATEVSHEYLH